MPKIHIRILILITTLLTTLTACTGENKMNIEQPNYYVKLNMLGCIRVIAVNGFEVESDFKGNSSAAEIPINHLIKNGENYFELIVPNEHTTLENWNATSKCEVEIRVNGAINGSPIDYKVADIVFSADYSLPGSNLTKNSMPTGNYQFVKGETTLTDHALDSVISDIKIMPAYEKGMDGVFKRNFLANVPFPTWSFFDGEKLFDGYHPLKNKDVYRSAKSSLWPKVEKLWDIFESKKMDEILPLFEFRSKEYDQAFYREPGNTLEQLENSLQNVYDNEYPLNRKESKKMKMVVSFANNLVTIVNGATTNGTVMFYDHESNSNTFYNVYWMQKDGEWIIAR